MFFMWLSVVWYVVFTFQRKPFTSMTFTSSDWRRSIYGHQIRGEQDGTFGIFDCPILCPFVGTFGANVQSAVFVGIF